MAKPAGRGDALVTLCLGLLRCLARPTVVCEPNGSNNFRRPTSEMASDESIELFGMTPNRFSPAATCSNIGSACDAIENALHAALDDLLADLSDADQHLVECAVDGIRDRMLAAIRSVRRSAAALFDEASV